MRREEFIAEMIPHHEAAIRMARAFLSGPDGNDPTLGALARDIASTQSTEIQTMKSAMARSSADDKNSGMDGLRAWLSSSRKAGT